MFRGLGVSVCAFANGCNGSFSAPRDRQKTAKSGRSKIIRVAPTKYGQLLSDQLVVLNVLLVFSKIERFLPES